MILPLTFPFAVTLTTFFIDFGYQSYVLGILQRSVKSIIECMGMQLKKAQNSCFEQIIYDFKVEEVSKICKFKKSLKKKEISLIKLSRIKSFFSP